MALTVFPSTYSGLDVPVSGVQQTETHRIPTTAPYSILLSRIPRCSAASTAVTNNAFTTIAAFRAECSLTIDGIPATIIEGQTPTASRQVACQIIAGEQYEFSPLVTFHSSDAGKVAEFTYFGFMSNADSRYIVALQQAVTRLEELPPCAIFALSTYDSGAFGRGTADGTRVYVTGTRGAIDTGSALLTFAGGTLNLTSGATQVAAFSDVDGYKTISVYLQLVSDVLALRIAESAESAAKPTTPTITVADGWLCGAVIVQGDGTGDDGGIEPIAQAECLSLWNIVGGGGASKTITTDTTYYVATNGSDTTGNGSETAPWATPEKALSVLGNYRVQGGKTVTIECNDGTYTFAAPITNLPTGFLLTGKQTYAKTMSSVQSSSGSAGAYSIVLNLNSVTDITTADDCILSAASGGTNPAYVTGYHAITNVDTENNRITIASTSRMGVPSGNVEATVTIIKTKFVYSGMTGVFVTNSPGGRLSKCGIVGNKAANTHGVQCDNGSITLTAPLGIRSFGASGIHCLNGGMVLADAIAISDNNNCDILAEGAGVISAIQAIITGNDGYGVACYGNAYINIYEAVIHGNAWATIDCMDFSKVSATASTLISDNIAVFASHFSHVIILDASVTGTTSPAVGIEGNSFACITV